jgi:hypothetical protein
MVMMGRCCILLAVVDSWLCCSCFCCCCCCCCCCCQDWCISRQLWWGHRIPVWYVHNCQAEADAAEEGRSDR